MYACNRNMYSLINNSNITRVLDSFPMPGVFDMSFFVINRKYTVVTVSEIDTRKIIQNSLEW